MNWKLNGHKVTGVGANEDWVYSAVFTRDGKNFFTGGRGDKLLKVWDIESGKIINSIKSHVGNWFLLTSAIFSIDVSPDGKKQLPQGVMAL